jgi:hypothetical protein
MRAKQISKNAFDASRVERAYCEGTRVVLEAAIIAHESRYNHVRIQVSDPPPVYNGPKKHGKRKITGHHTFSQQSQPSEQFEDS